MLAFFSACVTHTTDIPSDVPEIESIRFSCDPTEDQWTLRLFASSWTDGGEVVMATESRIEIHSMDSIRASPEQNSDELLMLLSIEANPDDAVGGRASGFLCTDALLQELSLRAGIFAYGTDEQEVDCWEWGVEKDFSPWDYQPCERVEPSES
jgi:hypothetical protein